MKPTYDFSTSRPSPPLPAPPKVRQRPSKQLLAIIAVIALLALAGALAYGRFSRSEHSRPADPRFCTASAGLTQALAAGGVPPVGIVPDPIRPEAVARAMEEAGSVGDLKTYAPSKIKSDVRLVVADLRAAAGGDMAAVRTSQFAGAKQRIAEFQKTPAGCPGGEAGSGSGDG